jgi:AAHS family 4-hydroxybenzoate transporter-like MFS transporter
MQSSKTLDVQQFINAHKVSRVQLLIMTLCFLIVAVDGFDTAAIGFIAPAIRSEWSLSAAQLAPLFGAGLAGLMLGAFVFGPLADNFGRKTILMTSVGVFGLASLVSTYSPSLEVLVLLRFLTGLGLGGAMPNSVTLTSEYCPEGRRSFLVTTMFCGFTLGSALGGLAAAHIVSALGWRAVLFLGGVLPLVLLPVLWLALPESVRYLVMRGDHAERVRSALQRIAPHENLAGVRFVLNDPRQEGFPVSRLFRNGLSRGTVFLWITFFMSLLVVYLLSSWLPTVINGTGMSLKQASLVTAMFQVGGTVGAIALGRFMDRFNPRLVLGASYALAAVFIALIGSSTGSPLLLVVAVFGTGVLLSGSQVGANALAAAFYPTGSRATGVSWASGVGRLGSVLGSMGGGALLSLNWGLPAMFVVVAIPALFAALGMLAMRTRGPVSLALAAEAH